MVNIRPLVISDPPFVKSIMAEHTLQFPYFIIDQYPARWRECLESAEGTKCGYYVAHTETILGHGGYMYRDELGLCELVGIVVKKDCRRRGIGVSMIDTLCSKVRELGGSKVILYTLGHIGNEETLTFYRRIGFEEVNHEPDYFMPGYHRVTFTKDVV